MRAFPHVVAMHIIDIVPGEKETAYCPAEELDPYKQSKVSVNFADEEVFVKGHNSLGLVGNK